MASRIAEKLAAKKAAIYIRVSTHWQVDKDSLKVQRRELIAYVTLVLGITDYVVFEDPGYSAKNTDRPEYQAMMDRIRTGEFTHLVVWKIDRISRNLIDFASMHDELQSLGVTFVSKNEQFDTSSAIGEAMMRINGCCTAALRFTSSQSGERHCEHYQRDASCTVDSSLGQLAHAFPVPVLPQPPRFGLPRSSTSSNSTGSSCFTRWNWQMRVPFGISVWRIATAGKPQMSSLPQ